MTVTAGAAYRYRWTPQPNVFDPAPAPRLSGIVDLGSRESSRIKAAAALAD